MLCCNETVTIARCSGTGWSLTQISGASWFTKAIGTMTDRGLQGSREIHCRIPGDCAPESLPAVGDYILRGAAESVTSVADLAAWEHGKITSVGDNRRGADRLSHISVVAS